MLIYINAVGLREQARGAAQWRSERVGGGVGMSGTRGEALVVRRVMLLWPVFGWLGGLQHRGGWCAKT